MDYDYKIVKPFKITNIRSSTGRFSEAGNYPVIMLYTEDGQLQFGIPDDDGALVWIFPNDCKIVVED